LLNKVFFWNSRCAGAVSEACAIILSIEFLTLPALIEFFFTSIQLIGCIATHLGPWTPRSEEVEIAIHAREKVQKLRSSKRNNKLFIQVLLVIDG
jgi:hypothetical protein